MKKMQIYLPEIFEEQKFDIRQIMYPQFYMLQFEIGGAYINNTSVSLTWIAFNGGFDS